MSWFLLLKFIHVLSAIIAFGANATYGVWNLRAERDEAHLGFALRGIKFIDDRIANPAYGVLLLTGLIMVFMRYSFTTLWVLLGIGGYVIVAAVAIAIYSPALRRQIEALDTGGPRSEAYLSALRRARAAGPLMGIVLVAVVFVMVVKPSV
jgi:uncharacterized membrane protein